MARETQTTRALREHASNLKAPSHRALRYLRSIVDNRPYTALPACNADLHELEELRQMGLWPLQTCNGARNARWEERGEADICGISQREEKAAKRVVQGLQGRQPELRLDYEDTSIIGRHRRRPVVTAATSHSSNNQVAGSRGIHTDTKPETRSIHTSAIQSQPSAVLLQPFTPPNKSQKWRKRRNNWQVELANAGRRQAEARRNDTTLFSQKLHTQSLTTAIDEANRNLEYRISDFMKTPSFQLPESGGSPYLREGATPEDQYRESTKELIFGARNARTLSMGTIYASMTAYRKTGRVAMAEAIAEKYKTGRKPSEKMMVIQLKLLLARHKVDAAIYFVQMAKDTATGFGASLTRALLEGICKLRVELSVLKRVFELVEGFFPVSQSIHYTSFIRGCVENGRLDLASEWVFKMQDAGHTPDAETYNAIIAATAKYGDWDTIKPLLDICKGKELEVSTFSKHQILEAASERTAISLEEAYQLKASLELPSCGRTWNPMLKAVLNKSSPESLEKNLEELFEKMAGSGFSPGRVFINTLISKLDNSGDPSPPILRRLLSTIPDHKVPHSGRTHDLLRSNILSNTSAKTTKSVVRKSADSRIHNTTALLMIAHLRELQPLEALKIFQAHISQSLRPSQNLLILAIKSVLLLPAQPSVPKEFSESEVTKLQIAHGQAKTDTLDQILQLSAKHGLDIHKSLSEPAWKYLTAVYSYRNEKSPKNWNSILLKPPKEELLFEVYKFYHKYEIKNPHHPLMVSISMLMNLKQYQEIVDLMRKVASSEWGQKAKFNIVALTILLKAYLALRDVKGVKWIAEHVVERGLEPDDEFMKVLKGEKRLRIAAYAPNWREVDEEVLEKSVEMCEELRERLKLKRQRNTQWILRASGKPYEANKSIPEDTQLAHSSYENEETH